MENKAMIVRVARAILNETGDKFVERFGLTKSYLSKIENGTRVVPIEVLAFSKKVVEEYYPSICGIGEIYFGNGTEMLFFDGKLEREVSNDTSSTCN